MWIQKDPRSRRINFCIFKFVLTPVVVVLGINTIYECVLIMYKSAQNTWVQMYKQYLCRTNNANSAQLHRSEVPIPPLMISIQCQCQLCSVPMQEAVRMSMKGFNNDFFLLPKPRNFFPNPYNNHILPLTLAISLLLCADIGESKHLGKKQQKKHCHHSVINFLFQDQIAPPTHYLQIWQ